MFAVDAAPGWGVAWSTTSALSDVAAWAAARSTSSLSWTGTVRTSATTTATARAMPAASRSRGIFLRKRIGDSGAREGGRAERRAAAETEPRHLHAEADRRLEVVVREDGHGQRGRHPHHEQRPGAEARELGREEQEERPVVQVDAVAQLAEVTHRREGQRLGGRTGAAADAREDDEPGEQRVELDAPVERRGVVEGDRVP